MDTFGLPFDYYSVMMYHQDASSTDGNITIKTRIDPFAQEFLGVAANPTSTDWLRLCSLYNCPMCAGAPFARNTSGYCPIEKAPKEDPECVGMLPDNSGVFESRCCQPKPLPPMPAPSDPICKFCYPPRDSLICNDSLIVSHPQYWDTYCCGHCGESGDFRGFSRDQSVGVTSGWELT